MKTIVKFIILVLVLNAFISCSKDEEPTPEPIAQPEPKPVPEPEPENQAPTQVSLLSPVADAENIDVRPTFSWETATDPDGDAITYEIYADTAATPSTLIGTTSETSFDLEERLGLLESYNWKVLAKDGKGGESESDSQNFDTRNIFFSNATQSADFQGRYQFGSAVFQDKVWLSGGTQNTTAEGRISNDVWYSEDGVNWTLATANAQWPARSRHTMTSFQNKLWVIGGQGAESANGDVWNSEDGINWNLVTDSPGFGGIRNHTTTVFNDKLYVIHDNRVWFSSDGIVWTLASDGIVGNSRRRHTALSFKDKLWIIGASSQSDSNVMSSSDGISWQVENAEPLFNGNSSNRDSHASVAFDGKMWVIAGFGLPSKNDVWFSEDGITWTLAAERGAFTSRLFPQSQVLNNKIWLFGGTTINQNNNAFDGTANLNDVWFID